MALHIEYTSLTLLGLGDHNLSNQLNLLLWFCLDHLPKVQFHLFGNSFHALNTFRHHPNSCFALSLKIGPAIFHLLTRKKQMKNRLAMEKIKITGVSIWLNCSPTH